MQVGPLIPPSKPKQGPLIPPSPKTSPQKKSQTRRQKKQTRKPCSGSRKTCRRRELRRRAAERRRREATLKAKIASAETSQSVEEASNGTQSSINSGYEEYLEYMKQGQHKGELIGELQIEIEELRDAGMHNAAAAKEKELELIVDKISNMDRIFH